jgi:hypothetical protein
MRKVDGFILAFDLTDTTSFKNLNEYFEEIIYIKENTPFAWVLGNYY